MRRYMELCGKVAGGGRELRQLRSAQTALQKGALALGAPMQGKGAGGEGKAQQQGGEPAAAASAAAGVDAGGAALQGHGQAAGGRELAGSAGVPGGSDAVALLMAEVEAVRPMYMRIHL